VTRHRDLRGILAAGGPPLTAALIGSLGSRDAGKVYQRLTKPRWAPPSSLFGPVWTGLYGLIGVAGWRMWRGRASVRTWGLHAAQLTLNAAWPLTFFTIRDKRTSLALITALDLLVAAQIVDVSRQDKVAAAALGPYLSWSLFATALNARVSEPTRTG
jgi:tryptophan-rich sensory protein